VTTTLLRVIPLLLGAALEVVARQPLAVSHPEHVSARVGGRDEHALRVPAPPFPLLGGRRRNAVRAQPLNTENVSTIVAQADLLSFSLALAACTIALDRATPLSFDSRDSHDSLWTYAVRVEPRATLNHHNVSNTFFRAGDLDRGAYHRFIDV